VNITTVTISKGVHKKLALFCAEHEKTKREVVEKAINEYIDKYNNNIKK